MSLSTHVLDAISGRPAAGVHVRLFEEVDGDWQATAEGHTDEDGRITRLGTPGTGVKRLWFDVGSYFDTVGVDAFYPEVTVAFRITDGAAHLHVPLLLSPFAYSTYRGS